MKKSKVLDLKRFRLGERTHTGGLTLLLLLSFAVGLLIGTLLCADSDVTRQTVMNFLRQFQKVHTQGQFFYSVFSVFLSSVVPLAVIFLSGTSMLGIVLAPLILCYRGYFYGASAAYLYSVYGIKGIAFHAVLIVPPAIPVLIALLIACKQAIAFSGLLAKLTFPHSSPAFLYPEFKRYSGRFLLLLLLILLSAVADACLSGAFYRSLAEFF